MLPVRFVMEEYLENSTLHGARFIVDKKSSWWEKTLWGLCLLSAWLACWKLIKVSMAAYENNAISFGVETSYREWKTNFPAIIVCESKNMERIQNYATQLWGVDHDFVLEEVLAEIAFFRGEAYYTIYECGDNAISSSNCFHNNFSYYSQFVRSDCKTVLKNCWWHNKPFDCCQFFKRMETELGLCYAINSLQSGITNEAKLNMWSDRFTGPGALRMDIYVEAVVFILGEEEVPTLVTSQADYLVVEPNTSFVRHISKRDIQNDEQLRDTSVSQRNCRFSDEYNLDVHHFYSYSACTVQCRRDKQLELCNCSSHLTPNTVDEQKCNMQGLRCLNENHEDLSVIIAKWSTGRRGLVCNCLPSCTEVDLNTVIDTEEAIYTENAVAKVEIALLELPTERYKRNVVRGKLDMVVSIGGTTGLFAGASLLSFVEILYYITIRPYGSVFYDKINFNRQKRKQGN